MWSHQRNQKPRSLTKSNREPTLNERKIIRKRWPKTCRHTSWLLKHVLWTLRLHLKVWILCTWAWTIAERCRRIDIRLGSQRSLKVAIKSINSWAERFADQSRIFLGNNFESRSHYFWFEIDCERKRKRFVEVYTRSVNDEGARWDG